LFAGGKKQHDGEAQRDHTQDLFHG
jgi:hypothetical protein